MLNPSRWIALGVALTLAATVPAPAVAGPPTPPTASLATAPSNPAPTVAMAPASPSAAFSQPHEAAALPLTTTGSGSTPAATAMSRVVAREGQDAEIEFTADGPRVTVAVTAAVPLRGLTLVLSGAGRAKLTASLPDLAAAATARRTWTVVRPADAAVVLTVQLRQRGTTIATGSRAAQLHHGALVLAPSRVLLPAALLAADHAAGRLDPIGYRNQSAALNAVPVPGASVSHGPASLAASGPVAVYGHVQYQRSDATWTPVRNARVALVVNDLGLTVAVGATNGNGDYTFNVTADASHTYHVELSSSNAYALILGASQQYVAATPTKVLQPGDTWTNVDLSLGNQTQDAAGLRTNAFAVLDALFTIGGFYTKNRQSGWPSQLEVTYPADGSYVGAQDGHIHISGGGALCGTGQPCQEDAYDWPVIAHETGHIVARHGGFDDSSGGAHDICNGAWSVSGSKSAGMKLAWSEGWATFFGTVALHEEAIPAGTPNLADATYSDRPGPPYYGGANFSYSMEDPASMCSPRGDDSELAVSRALWDFYDANADGESISWTFGDILGRMLSAHPTTFGAAWTALTGGRDVSVVQNAAQVLEQHGVASKITSGDQVVDPAKAYTISWTASGMGGHPNSYRLRFLNINTRAEMAAVTTTATSYTLTAADKTAISGWGTALVEVDASEGASPATGPYPSKWITLTTGVAGTTRVMIAGDSISHGTQGDYTWRYRLQKHFAANGVNADFVGPRRGVYNMWSVQDGTSNDDPNGYRAADAADTEHDALWGRQMNDEKNEIQAKVATYQPQYLVVELGFNDIAWGGVSGADLMTVLTQFVANARAGKSNVRLLLCTVPVNKNPTTFQRTQILDYNSRLRAAIPSLSTGTSPVKLVDLASAYDPNSYAYDPIHPNTQGEFRIARAVAGTFNAFGVGPVFGSIPATTEITLSAPAITVTPVAGGIQLSWSHVWGATGYYLYQRDVTAGQAQEQLPLPVTTDHWLFNWVQRGHTYEYAVAASKGDTNLAKSGTATAVANPSTADGPTIIHSFANDGSGTVNVDWIAPTGYGADTVSAYDLYWYDNTTQVLSNKRVWGLSTTFPGTVGHTYNIVIGAVNTYGSGFPGAAPNVYAGVRTPSPPSLDDVVWSTYHDAIVILHWTNSPQAAVGYRVWRRQINPDGSRTLWESVGIMYPGYTQGEIWFTPYGWRWEFYMTSINGTTEGPASNIKEAHYWS
ncbi:GDSL-type esterase/lipase family protein [Hamadaea tsunoensis]|uniref:GDSL-type esterase/lipase family protein n=1 Tax=Hamadaea tsunoensis TaxID=53368 RepID=UPI00146FA396|nr:GDSL-type esterase/lipase family protein [Hamadaea tsunoensis]